MNVHIGYVSAYTEAISLTIKTPCDLGGIVSWKNATARTVL